MLDQAALRRLLDISAELLAQLDLRSFADVDRDRRRRLARRLQIHLYRYVPGATCSRPGSFALAARVARLELGRGEGLPAPSLPQDGRAPRDYDTWPGRSPQWRPGVTGPSIAVSVRRADQLLESSPSPAPGPAVRRSDLNLLQLFANQTP
jgi:hypothetical protein